jgi:hypothetical protein
MLVLAVTSNTWIEYYSLKKLAIGDAFRGSVVYRSSTKKVVACE